VTIYYIDRRAPGRNEDLLTRVAALDGVRLLKGKVGKVSEKPGSLVLKVEDVDSGRISEAEADLVVLATGMVPNLDSDLAFTIDKDDDGFGLDDAAKGILMTGVARRPEDVATSVRDATGAAAKALVAAGRGA
jgi:quinone-modifying oxidoreductase subunit QmoA